MTGGGTRLMSTSADGRQVLLFLDTHLIADTSHTLDAGGYLDGAVDLALAVDKATELNFVLACHHGNVEALDSGISE
jgi:hypothetical protein